MTSKLKRFWQNSNFEEIFNWAAQVSTQLRPRPHPQPPYYTHLLANVMVNSGESYSEIGLFDLGLGFLFL